MEEEFDWAVFAQDLVNFLVGLAQFYIVLVDALQTFFDFLMEDNPSSPYG